MKLADVPRFTTPSYRVNVSPKGLLETIERWENRELYFELQPDFQRPLCWEPEDESRYIERLIQGHQQGIDFYFNHPNWGDSYDTSPDMPMCCVDGLQRITAFQRFFDNKVKVFGHYLNEYEDAGNFTRHFSNVTLNIYVTNVKTKKELLSWYIHLNDTGKPHSREELNRVAKMMEEL